MAIYKNEFGPTLGVAYGIYHELAHALPDGFVDLTDPAHEAIANSYGQGLDTMSGASYPNNSELQAVGGTHS